MENKVAVITGGSRGIGRAIALELAKQGYNICITYNTSCDKANKVKEEIESLGKECLVLQCDIAQEFLVKDMAYQVFKKFGRIDVLINNAAIAIDAMFCDKTMENFRKTIDVNLIGTFMVCKNIYEYMSLNESGVIINIASTNGINTYYPMCLDYDASKAGLISLTHNLAMQFAPKIRVNAVAPGFIATESEIKDMDEDFIKSEEEKIFLNRAGTEQDVANLVAFLVSDKASYINNEVIRIDGGIYGN